nr:hypothetical protein [Pseudomonadota bacterium]
GCSPDSLNPNRIYDCRRYRPATRHLREIFTHIDRREPAEHAGGSNVDVAHSGDLTKTKAYIDALNKHIKEFLDKFSDTTNEWLYRQRHYSEAELFTHALRQHTDALYKDTGLSWLYKQGRYHVMEGMDLLWSSPVQASAGPLGIVEAPGDRLLFILGRSSPRPQPDDITVWTYDKKKRAVTDTFSLTSILQIAHDGKNLILTEGWNQARFEAPYAPLRPRPHIYNKGRWTQGSKKYTEKYEYYQLNSYYHNRFIARLFLECRDDIRNCSHKDDFFKMRKELKELKELKDLFVGHQDRISFLDSNNTKVIPEQPQ